LVQQQQQPSHLEMLLLVLTQEPLELQQQQLIHGQQKYIHAAKYVVQMKNAGGDIEVLEVLVTIDGANNVYVTEYADVQSNGQLGTTDAVYNGASKSVELQVTGAAANTAVKVSKTYIEA
jgi:hypothetical protein